MNKKQILTICIIFSVSLIALNTILFLKGYEYIKNYSDAFFIIGGLQLITYFLIILGNFGNYDFFGYSFHYLLGGYKNKKYEDLVDYSEKMAEKRKTYSKIIPMFILGNGMIFMIIGIVISIFV